MIYRVVRDSRVSEKTDNMKEYTKSVLKNLKEEMTT